MAGANWENCLESKCQLVCPPCTDFVDLPSKLCGLKLVRTRQYLRKRKRPTPNSKKRVRPTTRKQTKKKPNLATRWRRLCEMLGVNKRVSEACPKCFAISQPALTDYFIGIISGSTSLALLAMAVCQSLGCSHYDRLRRAPAALSYREAPAANVFSI